MTECASLFSFKERARVRVEHMTRSDALQAMAFRLSDAGAISDDEMNLLYAQALEEWDDAIHIAAPDDPLKSLCGKLGRNLADMPDRPGDGSGCWTCLTVADEIAPRQREAVTA